MIVFCLHSSVTLKQDIDEVNNNVKSSKKTTTPPPIVVKNVNEEEQHEKIHAKP